MSLLGTYTTKELTVWAVVFNKTVIDTHIGPPETYQNDEFDVALVQYSNDRGFPSVGDIWDGERFRKNA
jgi:hypothetical protein